MLDVDAGAFPVGGGDIAQQPRVKALAGFAPAELGIVVANMIMGAPPEPEVAQPTPAPAAPAEPAAADDDTTIELGPIMVGSSESEGEVEGGEAAPEGE